ncbi:uncharacterized protein LOC110452382 isoform X2 [Mizuhopecten yessoensis]|uniref:uncharacterized protein LOC110452382 isoform X2 n=1 Tax=Mizuhopecten yessoensis TaxID=6573 RepID=UPI000B45C4EE|nr:uncharacterized protein LOC110452382 isoform X2 [Mizuhopecten yessoensis]
MEDYNPLLILLFVCLASCNAQSYPPTNVKAVYVADGTIRVTWDPPTTPGRSDGYSVRIQETGEYGHVSADHRVYQFNNTRPATTYTLRVATIISDRVTGPSQTTITTPTAIYRQRGTGARLTLPKPPGGISTIRLNSQTLFTFIDNDNIGGNNRIEYGATVRVTSTKTELTFDRLKTEHAGYYYTIQQSGYIILGGQMLVVTDTPTRPKITSSNASPVLNTSVRLVCSSASRSQPDNHGLVLTATWKLNGSALNHARFSVKGLSLTINAVRFTDKYDVYACVASEKGQGVSGLSSGESEEVKLTPRYGPQFVTIENNEDKSPGISGNAYGPVSCRTDCNPFCLMEWRRQGIPFIQSHGDPSNELELRDPSLPREREVTYTCQVEVASSAGFTAPTLENSTTVIVYYGPQFVTIESKEDKSPVISGNAYGPMSCRTDCNPFCLLEWRRQGKLFIQSRRDSGNELEWIDPLLPRVREVTYTCQVKVASSAGFTAPTLENSTTVIVYFPPNITELKYRNGVDNQYMQFGSSEVRYTEGSSLELRVNVDSNPPADVDLLRNQTRLAVGVTVSTGIYDIKLNNLQCNNTGRYDVRSVNLVPRNRSNVITSGRQFELQVSCAPRRFNTMNSIIRVTGKKGQTAVLNVTVVANPMPTSKWSDGVRALDVVHNNAYTYTMKGEVIITTQSDFQRYHLNATNTLPNVLTVHFQISPEGVPDIPMDFRASKVSDNYVNVVWTSGFNGGFSQHFNIDFKTVGSEWLPVSSVDIPDAGQGLQMTYPLFDLTPATDYVIRLNVSTRHRSGMSTEIRVRTLEIPQKPNTQLNLTIGLGICGVVVLVCFVVIAALVIKRRQRQQDQTDANLNQNTQDNTTSLELQSRVTIHGRRNNGDDEQEYAYAIVDEGIQSHHEVQTQKQEHAYAIVDEGIQSHHEVQTQKQEHAYAIVDEGIQSHHEVQTQSKTDAKLSQNTQGNTTSLELQSRATIQGRRNNGDEGGAIHNDDNSKHTYLELIGDDNNAYMEMKPPEGDASQNDETDKYLDLEQTGGQEHVYETTHPEHRDGGAIGGRKGRARKDKKRRHTLQQ